MLSWADVLLAWPERSALITRSTWSAVIWGWGGLPRPLADPLRY